jgi:hypothetical protein
MNKIMDTLHYDCINECADNIFHIYNELTIYDDLANINIIAKYNEAKKFVERFIRLGFDIVSISELSEADINGYNDEYVIALDRDGLWCTPAKYEDKYLYVKADVVYILDNCCSKVIPNIESRISFEVEINDDCEDNEEYSCECDGNYANCYCNDNNDDDFDYEKYSINGKEITEEDYKKALDGISDFLGFVNKIWEYI